MENKCVNTLSFVFRFVLFWSSISLVLIFCFGVFFATRFAITPSIWQVDIGDYVDTVDYSELNTV